MGRPGGIGGLLDAGWVGQGYAAGLAVVWNLAVTPYYSPWPTLKLVLTKKGRILSI